MWDPAIKEWLGGIEPAWTMLDPDSLAALRRAPSPVFGPIRLAADLTTDEVRQSPVARNALMVLSAADTSPGLKMTATGNLSRAVVADMAERFVWPGFNKVEDFRLNKVTNETDFLPLLFVRRVTQAAQLLRRHKGHFRTTPNGRKMLAQPGLQALQAVLFHVAFWHLELGYVSQNHHGTWPQRDAGTVLWCLSVAAHDWQPPERLARLCTIPVPPRPDLNWDTPTFAMRDQILGPLTWFGLLEEREDPPEPGRFVEPRFFRKTPLFDRLLSFDVRLVKDDTPRH